MVMHQYRYNTMFNEWLMDTFLNTSAAPKNDSLWFAKSVNSALTKYTKSHDDKALIVGLCGHAGVGKDSAISYVIKECNAGSMAFASPLKKIAQIVGFSYDQLTDRKLKETPDEFWGISPRQFLQMCGTEMFRKVWREDVWVEIAKRTILNTRGATQVIFVTDVRFPNEAKMIKDIGGIIVKIERPDNPLAIDTQHTSESLVDTLPVDLRINNTCKSSEEWSWKFTKELIQFIQYDAFYH